MTVRYGVALVPEPVFTARAYRTRQLVCGQYATWAAEMHLLHLTVADFFRCEEAAVEAVDRGLSNISGEVRQNAPQFLLRQRGVATFPGVSGNIFLDFSTESPPSVPPASGGETGGVYALHRAVTELLQGTSGVTPDLRFTGENYWPHITLMQQASLPPSVFESAVEFAAAVAQDLSVPESTRAWQLILVRFESDAAGDDWDNGRWAADLRWQIVASYPL